MYGPGYPVLISCAKIPGDHYAGSHGNSGKETDHEKYEGAGGGHSRQGIGSQKSTHNQRICRIIQLLKHLT